MLECRKIGDTMATLAFATQWFNANPEIFICYMFVLGACLGSFMALIGARYPRMYEANILEQCLGFLAEKKHPLLAGKNPEDFLDKNYPTLSKPGSICDLCKKKLRWYENFPIFGYLKQLGKCGCKKFKIPMDFFLTEVTFGLVLAFTGYKYGFSVQTLLWSIFWFNMGALFLIDAKSKWLPEQFVEYSALTALVILFFGQNEITVTHGIWTAIGVYIGLRIIVKIANWVFKKDGMGFGDFQLFGVLGIVFGFSKMLNIIILSCLIGIIFGIMYRLKNKEEQFPFGPSIITAAFIVWGWTDLFPYIKI